MRNRVKERRNEMKVRMKGREMRGKVRKVEGKDQIEGRAKAKDGWDGQKEEDGERSQRRTQK